MPFLKKLIRPTANVTGIKEGLDTGVDTELYATNGPTGIRVIADPSEAVIDVVFVHGLTGNREKTWTHRNGTFWPNALSQDFPHARIMTFGYDADVVRFWTITSSNRLDDHGKSLAYAVLDQRAKVGQRPIVFVAHSLGGLVCEEALNLSTKRQDLADILPNTLGIIFMGTPHGGSHLANWGSTVAKYVNVFRGTNREILGNLQPGSSDLLRTEEDFQHTLRRDDVKLMIYCFYEALKMNDIIGKVVEREAAILHGYDNCSINADHRTMTKFTGRADAGYGQVRGVLERWTRKHETRCSDARETTRVLMTGNSDRAEPSTNGPSSDGPSPSGPSHNGPVFSGPISGHYVIPGTYTTGGTVNFNVAG